MSSPDLPRLHVSEVHGDLLEQAAVALVNPWNRNFVPRWLLLPVRRQRPAEEAHGARTLARARTSWHARGGTGGGHRDGRMRVLRIWSTSPASHTYWRASESSIRLSALNAVLAAAGVGAASLAMPCRTAHGPETVGGSSRYGPTGLVRSNPVRGEGVDVGVPDLAPPVHLTRPIVVLVNAPLPQLAFAPLTVDQHLDVGALGGAVGADGGHGRTVAATSDADGRCATALNEAPLNGTQPVPEFDVAHEAYEAWRDLQDVLEERDAEWWAEQNSDDDA
jgi:hypothetical protein